MRLLVTPTPGTFSPRTFARSSSNHGSGIELVSLLLHKSRKARFHDRIGTLFSALMPWHADDPWFL